MSWSSRLYSALCASPVFFFFFNDPATPEIYTLSLPDALPIYADTKGVIREERTRLAGNVLVWERGGVDRKSTRLNSSHSQISYAVFCLKKKNRAPGHAERVISALDDYRNQHGRAVSARLRIYV